MPASVFTNSSVEERTQEHVENVLPYHQNCAAMAFSRVLGISVYATLSLFLKKGWIATANATQHDGRIAELIEHLDLEEQYLDRPWAEVKTGLSGLADGRYFAVNSGVVKFKATGDHIGHAFAIVKKGGWSVYANNSELNQGKQYAKTIMPTHKISVWGPIAWG
jgi:hypothetical protein